MKNYAIASIISIGVGFLTSIIMQITVLTPIMNGSTYTDIEGIVFGILPIIAIFGVLSLGLGIYVLVCYFQYISALKHAGEEANDPNLTRAYKMELWGLILTIILPVIFVIALIAILPNILNFAYFEYDPYVPVDEMMSTILLSLIFIYLLVIVCALTVVVLQIVAKFAVDSWATGIVNMYSGNPYAINMQEGTALMKWGALAQICFGGIGSLVFIIGLFRAGKYAILLFSSPPSISPTRAQQVPYSGYGSTPEFQSYYQPNVSGSTIRPSTISKSSICPACGTMLPDPSAHFCPNCGRAL